MKSPLKKIAECYILVFSVLVAQVDRAVAS